MASDYIDKFVIFGNGKSIKKLDKGKYPIYGANGIIGWSDDYNYSNVIAIGRVGSTGTVTKISGKCWLSDNTISVKNRDNSHLDYIYFLLQSKDIKRLSIGSTQPLITQGILKNITHDFHSLRDQKAIANILSSLDDKIELNNKINKNLEELAQTLYKRWFVDFEFPNEDGEPYKSSGGEMVESGLGLIPKGWEIVNLIDIVDKFNGYSYKGTDLGKSNVGMLTIKNSTREKLFNIEGFKELRNTERVKDRHYAKQGEVLIVCTDVTQNADYIGNAVYIYTSKQYKNLVFSMDLIKLVSKREEISNHLVYEITRDARFKNFALGYTKGTTVLHLNKDVINDYKLALPNKQILILFDNLVSSIHDEVRSKINENIELVKLRDTLLPKLMSGEIEVPVKE
jgi:type I restriction enzyme, S subunit